MVLLYYYVYFFVFHAIRFQVTVYCICGNFLQPILILIFAPYDHCDLEPQVALVSFTYSFVLFVVSCLFISLVIAQECSTLVPVGLFHNLI